VIQAVGGQQLISPGAKAVMAYDPLTGKELWKVRYNGWSVTPRPLFGHGMVFLVTDYEQPELWAVRPDGRGDVTATNVAWKINKGVAAQPSSLLVRDLLYMVNDRGIAMAIEAKTGEVVWRERLGGNYSASPVYADGRLWFFSQEAVTTAIEPGRECKIVAVNRLEEQVMASPAVAGKAFFLRTRTHLYRIEKAPAKIAPAGAPCNCDDAAEEKGTVPICAKHPSGRSGKWGLSPFLPSSLPYSTIFSSAPGWMFPCSTAGSAADLSALR
jgi:hypothetical protein